MNWQLNNIEPSLPDILNAVLGVLLFFSPWLIGFADEANAAWNAHIVGVIIVGLVLAEIFAFKTWEEWIGLGLGVWSMFAPWVLGFSANEAALGMHVIVGLTTIVLATWSLNKHGSGGLPTRR